MADWRAREYTEEIPRTVRSKAEWADSAVSMYVDGHKRVAEIAKECGVTKQRIYQILSARGIETQNRRPRGSGGGPRIAKTHGCAKCDKPIAISSTYCRECAKEAYSGPNSRLWRGGRRITKEGYVWLRAKDHPGRMGNGYISEHVLVIEESIGRMLVQGELIHHKNGIRADNRLENLELWSTSHPHGARVEDLVVWAKDILELYEKSDD